MTDTIWPLLHAPIFMNWNLTYDCPFSCMHCYSRGRNGKEKLSLEDKLKIADNIIRNGTFFVNFGGGEPFCDKDLIPVVKHLHQGGVYVNVSTNGYHIKSEQADALIQAGLNCIIVSIDSADEKVHDTVRNHEGAFAEMLKSVEYFVSHNVKVTISTVITKKNVYELEKIFQLAEKLQCTEIELKRMKLAGNALHAMELVLNQEEEEFLYANIKEWQKNYKIEMRLIYSSTRISGIESGCPCGKAVLTILDNGDLSACAYSPVIIGNALKDEISNVWMNSPELQKMRSEHICPGLNIS